MELVPNHFDLFNELCSIPKKMNKQNIIGERKIFMFVLIRLLIYIPPVPDIKDRIFFINIIFRNV